MSSLKRPDSKGPWSGIIEAGRTAAAKTGYVPREAAVRLGGVDGFLGRTPRDDQLVRCQSARF